MKYFLNLCILLLSFSSHAQKTMVKSIPFELVDNRPFVSVKINDSNEIYHFVLDCGAVNLIDSGLAKKLDLNLENHRKVQGVGESNVDLYNTSIGKLQFGGFELINESYLSLDLNKIKSNLSLPYLDGIIGYDFFEQGILEIDYINKQFHIHEQFTTTGGIPFTLFHNQIPLVKASIDGIEGDFIIDTGDRSAITLRRHFYNELPGQYELSDTTVTGYSIGGPINAQLTTLPSFVIANEIELKNVNTRVIAMKGGRFTSAEIDGSIGGDILKSYKLIIDYNNHILYLK